MRVTGTSTTKTRVWCSPFLLVSSRSQSRRRTPSRRRLFSYLWLKQSMLLVLIFIHLSFRLHAFVPEQLSSRGSQSCASGSGSLKCWGQNSYGQLGLGDTSDRGDVPTQMGDALPEVDVGIKSVTRVVAGVDHTCALLDDANMKCWGGNAYGQLGLGDTSSRANQAAEMGDALPPVDLGTGKQVVEIAAGDYHTCARFDDNTLKCWGRNDVGQLGVADTSNRGAGPGEMGDALPNLVDHSCFSRDCLLVFCWQNILTPFLASKT